jgi:peptidyl-prolyl cis-trans isomerase C
MLFMNRYRYNRIDMSTKSIIFLLIFIGVCVGCQNQNIVQTPLLTSVPTRLSATRTSTLTPTPFQPSPTPIPLAARVNGDGITLAEFQAELARYRAALPIDNSKPGEAEKIVLDDLIDRVLLVQGSRQAGYVLDDEKIKSRLDLLIQDVGNEEAFNKWLANNGYSLETFQVALERSIAVTWMRDWITAQVPQTAEQIHARQILLFNVDQANQVLGQLQAGKDFATLAFDYDPVAGGDLGWFPRGYLTEIKIEEAAFNLQPGEYSAVIQTRLGYHIVEVIERQADRPLDPDALRTLQASALVEWLKNRREQSEIIVLISIPN